MAKKKSNGVKTTISNAAENVKDTAANVGSTIASTAEGALATAK